MRLHPCLQSLTVLGVNQGTELCDTGTWILAIKRPLLPCFELFSQPSPPHRPSACVTLPCLRSAPIMPSPSYVPHPQSHYGANQTSTEVSFYSFFVVPNCFIVSILMCSCLWLQETVIIQDGIRYYPERGDWSPVYVPHNPVSFLDILENNSSLLNANYTYYYHFSFWLLLRISTLLVRFIDKKQASLGKALLMWNRYVSLLISSPCSPRH